MQSQRQVLGQLGVDIPSHWDEFDEFMIVRIMLALGGTRGLRGRSLCQQRRRRVEKKRLRCERTDACAAVNVRKRHE
jgi:hypothetical protein